MKKFSRFAFGALSTFISLTNLFEENLGFKYELSIERSIGYNIVVATFYVGAMWFIYSLFRQYRKNKIKEKSKDLF